MLNEAPSTDIWGTHAMMAPVVPTVGTALLHTPPYSFFSVFLDKRSQASRELMEGFLLPLAWQTRCSFRVKRKTSYLITLHVPREEKPHFPCRRQMWAQTPGDPCVQHSLQVVGELAA